MVIALRTDVLILFDRASIHSRTAAGTLLPEAFGDSAFLSFRLVLPGFYIRFGLTHFELPLFITGRSSDRNLLAGASSFVSRSIGLNDFDELIFAASEH